VLTVQILALSGIRESTMMLNGLVYRALGVPQRHALLMLASTPCFLVAFWIGLEFGIEGVALFYALTGLLWHPVSWWLLLGAMNLPLRRWLAILAIPALATIWASLVAILVLHAGRTTLAMSEPLVLALTWLAAGLSYGIVLILVTPPSLRRLVSTILLICRQFQHDLLHDYTN
jgi:hypothetical protein